MIAGLDISFELNGDVLDTDGARAGFLLLAGMLGSFGFIRMSTRLMRSPKVPWWPGSVETSGGLHIHHLVFGIALMMLFGFLGFALQPDSPWLEIFAVLFGIGVGLTLDEFALWLYLEDVYWSEEGRRSVDAVFVATIIAGFLLLGFVPFGSESDSSLGLVIAIAINLAACVFAAFKGKIASALVGVFVPPVSFIAAIRLARPSSPWGRRRYEAGSKKLAKAEAREGRRRDRVVRWQNRIGGAPTPAAAPEPAPAPEADESD